MELKTARLTLLIDPNKKAAFERLCAGQDRTASQVVRQFIRDYLALHGVQYVPSGSLPKPADPIDPIDPIDPADPADPAEKAAPSRTKPRLRRTAASPAKRPASRRKA
jgi:hypothetical protein